VFGHDPVQHFRRECPGPAEGGASGLQGAQCVPGALADEPPLVLGEAGHDVRHHLPAGRRGVHLQIESHEPPTSSPGALHQGGEVEEAAAKPIELGCHQGSGSALFNVG